MSEGAQKALREEKNLCYVGPPIDSKLTPQRRAQGGWILPYGAFQMPAGRHKMQHALSIT